ncbi:hypothetical protein LTS18_011375 [Coniosporium uncinatum]|uniref:Uncharacterized protein n=1 Tax=Coniosporium uncinatum TaxID=93489 RepID=A0ACC3DKE0_9PEZI|nr:hypothetical protein LTS18_011375 [Coniosporium uncinatum]
MVASWRLAAIAGVLVETITAASIADLPQCAQMAVLQTLLVSKCSPTDTPCICADTTLTASLQAGIVKNCPPWQQAAALRVAASVCPGAFTVSGLAATTTTTSSFSSTQPTTTYSTILAPTSFNGTLSVSEMGLILTDTKPFTTSVPPSTTTSYIFSGTSTFVSANATGTPSRGERAPLPPPMPFGKVRVGFVVAGMVGMGWVFAEL